jgi:hypothetical protein
MRSKDAIPSSPHATASPSMMQERERRRARVSTISENRAVRSLPGRLYSLIRLSYFRAMTLMPSCLISCSHCSTGGALGAAVGKQGAMKPGGRVGGPNDHMMVADSGAGTKRQRTAALPAVDRAAMLPESTSSLLK